MKGRTRIYDDEQRKFQAKLCRIRSDLKLFGKLNLDKIPEEIFTEYLNGTKEEVIKHLDEVVKKYNLPKKAYNKTEKYKITSILEKETKLPISLINYYKNLTIIKIKT